MNCNGACWSLRARYPFLLLAVSLENNSFTLPEQYHWVIYA